MFAALLRPQDHLQQTNTLFGKVENLAAPTSYLFRSHWHGWLCLKVWCHHGRFDVAMDDLIATVRVFGRRVRADHGLHNSHCWGSHFGELVSSKMSSKWAVYELALVYLQILMDFDGLLRALFSRVLIELSENVWRILLGSSPDWEYSMKIFQIALFSYDSYVTVLWKLNFVEKNVFALLLTAFRHRDRWPRCSDN